MSWKRSRSRWFVLLILTGVGLGALLAVFLWQPLARAGDLDEEPLPQEEQPGWFIYWETYDEPGDNEPIETHPSQWAGGGDPPQGRAALCAGEMRIFPDKKTYTDEHPDKRRLVFAVVEFTEEPEPPEGMKMWFRLWDVDDPSANGPPIDTKPEGDPGMNGPDNSDESWAMAGVAQQNGMILVEVGTIRRFDRLDDCDKKLCKVAVRVGMQPGDNWRFCAAKEEDETALRDMTQYQADRWTPPPRVAESRMLTTWRKLHLELDSMDTNSGLDHAVSSHIDAVYPDAPHAGESGAEIDGWNPEDNGRYEGGIANTSIGSGPVVPFDIIDHWDDTGDDTLYVVKDITPYNGQSICFIDDDLMAPPRTVNWSLVNEKFAPAYIEAVEDEEAHSSDVTFIPTVKGPEVALISKKSRITAPNYWVAFFLAAHQAYKQPDPEHGDPGDDPGSIISRVDGDPDLLYHIHPGQPPLEGDGELVFGKTAPWYPSAECAWNVSLVFLEACREYGAWSMQDPPWLLPEFICTAADVEKRTVAHELGHQFGWWQEGPAGTLMHPMSIISNDSQKHRFNEDQIRQFREGTEIEKEPTEW